MAIMSWEDLVDVEEREARDTLPLQAGRLIILEGFEIYEEDFTCNP